MRAGIPMLPIGEHGRSWFSELCGKVGIKDESRVQIIEKMSEFGITSEAHLKMVFQGREVNGQDLGPADLLIPLPCRKQLKKLLLERRLSCSKWEVHVASELSNVVYGGHDQAKEHFQHHRDPSLFLHAQCPITEQKYVCAVLASPDAIGSANPNIMFVAFAGTHLDGDWNTNLNIAPIASLAAGASVHTGFLRRAGATKYDAIRRLATQFGCKRIVFTGHSLGGAVSHLSCLHVLVQRPDFEQIGISVFSCAFAAPFVGLKQVGCNVERFGWTEHFVNFVNSKDPVPRLLNLAQTIPEVGNSAGNAIGSSAAMAGVGGDGLAQMATKLVSVVPAVFATNISATLVEFLNVYEPFGLYVFMDEQGSYNLSESISSIMEQLGPAELINKKVSLAGFVNQDNIAQHGIAIYQRCIQTSNADEFLTQHCREMSSVIPALATPSSGEGEESATPQESALSDGDTTPKFRVDGASAYVQDGNILFNIYGQNLDFISAQAIDVNPEEEVGKWGREGVEAQQISCPSPFRMHLVQVFKRGHLPEPLEPDQSVNLKFSPDIGSPVTFRLEYRNFIGAAKVTTELRFDDYFFRRAMKVAWLLVQMRRSEELLVRLQKVQAILNAQSTFRRKISNMPADLRQRFLCLGIKEPKWSDDEALVKIAEGEDNAALLEAATKWLCPPQGISLLTNGQVARRTAAVVAGIGLGAGFVCFGGLGVFGALAAWISGTSGGIAAAATAGSLTGGWGWAILSTLGAGWGASAIGTLLSAQYSNLLHELLGGAGCADPLMPTWSEFEKEEILIQLVNRNLHETKTHFSHGYLQNLTAASNREMVSRLEVIMLIHEMKHFMQIPIVAVSGPANSGKTTLISQILMDANLELKTGFGYRGRTSGVMPYQLGDESGSGAIIIDSPGLDAAQRKLLLQFESSSVMMGKAYVYIRNWAGPEQRDDINTALNILDFSSDPSPHLLIVLNKVIQNRRAVRKVLTWDELQAINVGIQEELKKQYAQKQAEEWGSELVERMKARWERKFKNVHIVFGDLALNRADRHKSDPDIAPHIYDARHVAEWCAEVVDPDGANAALQRAIKQIDLDTWKVTCDRLEDEMNPQIDVE